MTHEANIEGSVRADHIELDPTAPLPEALPEAPPAGLVLAAIHGGHAAASASHLLEICGRWSAEGRDVFLADALFERPCLHEAAGVANGEGLSDALLYGTTLPRIAVPLASGVRFASAGTVVGDPDGVLDHARWETIVAGFEEAGVLLVVAVPAESAHGRLSSRARCRLSFSRASDATSEVEREDAPTLTDATESDALGDDWGGIDVVSPSDEPAFEGSDVAAGAGEVHPFDAPSDTADEGSADAARPGGGADGSTDARPEPRAAPRSAPPRPSSESRRSSPLTLLLLVVVLGLIALGYLGVIDIPYITPTDLDITG